MTTEENIYEDNDEFLDEAEYIDELVLFESWTA